jgi:periplasmic protein TonB
MSFVTQNRRQNPGSMAAAIAVNGAIIAAVMLSPLVVNPPAKPDRTITFTVPQKQPPPPDKIDDRQTEARPLDPIFTPPTPLPFKPKEDPPFTTNDPPENTGGAMDGGGKGDAVDFVPKVDDPPIPIFRPATRDMRFAREFQPDYPSGLIQREIEGSATIRVLIGADGRVREASVVRASHPDFGKAAVRQALKAWRFKPATRGDAAVEDWQTISITFVID